MVARNGVKLVGEQTIRTAGAPHHIVLKTTYQGNLAYGSAEPTTFVVVNVVDKDGNLCPNAENQIFFSSDAQIPGTDNGCQTSLERFTDPHRKAFFGKCVVVLKRKGKLQAKAVDLKEAALELYNNFTSPYAKVQFFRNAIIKKSFGNNAMFTSGGLFCR